MDAETEEEEEGYHAPLTALPWGTQESGARGLLVGARAGRSDDGKGTSATADGGETRGRHGARKEQGGNKRGRRGWEGAEPWGVGGNSESRKASVVDPKPHVEEWEEGGREASRVEETPGGASTEWGGGVNRLQTTRPTTERVGGSSHPRTNRPPMEGEN